MSHASAFRLPVVFRAPLANAIFWSGLIAGVLDLLYVSVFVALRGASPVLMLQGIAAALAGPTARTAGAWGFAVLGTLMHFAVAYAWAAVFCVAASRLSFLRRQPGLIGPVYGAAVWLVMQRVVLPVTSTPPKSFPPANWEPVFLAHLLCVGLPIALVAQRCLTAPPADASATEQ